MSLIPPKPLCAGGKRVPPYRFLLCRSHPLRGANPQRFLIPCIVRTGLAGCLFVYRAVPRFSAVFIPAPLSAVEVCFRTSLCGHVFSGSRSPVATCHRAALLIGLPLCLQRSGYLSRFACAGLSPVGATQPSPLSDSNRPHPLTVHAPGATWHIKARQLRLLHGVQVIDKLIFNVLPLYILKLATKLHAFAICVQHRLAATVGTAHRSCTFAAPLLRNAAPLNMAIQYISPAKRLTS